jgi:YcxB-like protein
VQFSVHYTKDLKRTYRVSTRLRRASFIRFRVGGALLVLLAGLGVWSAAFSPGTGLAYGACGVLVGVLPDAAVWLNLLRNREVFAVDVDVELTDGGISSRTATQATSIEWGMVRRVLETDDCWIFVVNRLQAVSLYKAALTPLQRSQLDAFLDRGIPAR